MIRISRIGILSFAKLFALSFGLLGFVAGVVYSVGGAAYDLVATGSLNLGTALAFLALIGMPLLFGVAGGIAGLIVAPLFNLLARRMGGVELELEE